MFLLLYNIPMKLYNTLSRKVEEFNPLDPSLVTLYTCGPTVYDNTHIGHLRKYTNDDLLKRALLFNGYKVKHVQNITDVGHLVSDEDAGEDKMEKGARRAGKTVWEIARFYEEVFHEALRKMNTIAPDVSCRATEHIAEQIDLIKKLSDKGYTYETPETVYFDTSKFAAYGQLSGQNLQDKKVGVRDGVKVDPNKKNPADFALWIKRVGEHKEHTMHWDSPWGDGFPGWHIECSAMSMKYLGETVDIHTGGVDHIAVHHEDEIAQSEAATGKKFVNFWVHYEFLDVDGTKMSKSLQNFYTLEDLAGRGFSPMSLRYLFLGTHYRQKMNFTFEALTGAQQALENIHKRVLEKKMVQGGGESKASAGYLQKFLEAINDDLNMPKALAVFWEALKDDKSTYEAIIAMDSVLGLQLDQAEAKVIPQEVLDLAAKRDELRKSKNFVEADQVRAQIENMGFRVEDSTSGTKVS